MENFLKLVRKEEHYAFTEIPESGNFYVYNRKSFRKTQILFKSFYDVNECSVKLLREVVILGTTYFPMCIRFNGDDVCDRFYYSLTGEYEPGQVLFFTKEKERDRMYYYVIGLEPITFEDVEDEKDDMEIIEDEENINNNKQSSNDEFDM